MSPFSLLLTLSNYFQICSLSVPSENKRSLKESIGLKWLDLVSKVAWSSGINLSLFEKVQLLLFLWCWKPWRQYHYRIYDNFGTLRTGDNQRLYLVEVESSSVTKYIKNSWVIVTHCNMKIPDSQGFGISWFWYLNQGHYSSM